ncbi:CPL23 [Auxenochlorella protothecoides x Auxenochlorella symbiontica]
MPRDATPAACSSGTPGFWGQYRPNAGTNRPFLSLPKLESQQKPVKASTDIALPGMGGGDSGLGGGGDGTGGKGEGAGWNEDDGEEYLNLAQAEELAAAKNIKLPADFAAAAVEGGLRLSTLQHYISLLSGGWLTRWLASTIPAFRDRLIADRMFLFKVLAEVTIDTGCATVAEVRKRGDEFWGEFEFYLSDLMVGLVLDVVLVGLLAPVALKGRKPRAQTGWIKKRLAALPSAVFEASTPTRPYTVLGRLGCLGVKALEYSLAGFACGLVGQGVANSLMIVKRKYQGAREDDVAVPPLIGTALVWGLFMGVSSNVRYQTVFGLERLVELTIARRFPPIAYGTTVAIRFANNVIGGEQFVDLARWAGVQ